jgi:type II secretory pathway pseudopilin PulG
MRTIIPRNSNAGFTMVEIAICLGVIAIALVAIIGVLPTGARVQRDNREETIVEQDAKYIIEAIRSGARLLPDITNRVDRTNGAVPPGGVVDATDFISFLTTGVNRHSEIRAVAGPAVNRSGVAALQDLSFRYRLTSSVRRHTNTVSDYPLTLRTNLYEVRLVFEWPVRPDGTVAAAPGTGSPKVYNLLVSGHFQSYAGDRLLRP